MWNIYIVVHVFNLRIGSSRNKRVEYYIHCTDVLHSSTIYVSYNNTSCSLAGMSGSLMDLHPDRDIVLLLSLAHTHTHTHECRVHSPPLLAFDR